MSKASAFGILAVALAVTATAGPWGCSCGDDAARAGAERAKLRTQVERSIPLVPYRTLKVVARASAGGDERPAELVRVVEQLPGPSALPTSASTPEDAKKLADAAVDVAVLLYENRVALARLDEDRFPLLWTAWVRKPLPVSWYGAETEHLALATTWTVGELVSGASPVMDFSLYELSRAEPRDDWPVVQTLWARLVRGVTYAGGGYRLAAEEEYDAYLAVLGRCSPAEVQAMRLPGVELPLVELARAAGHLGRGLNRAALLRKKPAVDDFEAALDALRRAGVENEATWWATAFVAHARGRHAEAAEALEKLAASPYLDAAVKEEILAASKEIKKPKPGVFGSARAATIVGGALLARAGGAEALVTRVLGPETTPEVLGPMAWLRRMREGVARYATPDALGMAVRERAKESAAKGLESLKQKAAEMKAAVVAPRPVTPPPAADAGSPAPAQ